MHLKGHVEEVLILSLLVLSKIFKKCHYAHSKEQHFKKEIKSTI